MFREKVTCEGTILGGKACYNADGGGGDIVYYGRFDDDGEMVMAGKFFGGTLGLYGPDGQFHSNPRYEKLYYEGEFDEISDEEFEKFKAEMDAKGKTEMKREKMIRSVQSWAISLARVSSSTTI